MKFFSDCSGECCVCVCGAVGYACLAGHGDDDFSLASKDQIIENLDKDRYDSRDHMIKTLKEVYNYEYKEDN